MADYMDMINSALKKAKDFADNGNIKDIVDQGKSIAGEVSSFAKVKVSQARDEEELKRTYIEIGKLYYDENKNNPDGFYIPLFEKVAELTEAINVQRLEADTLKNSILPKDTAEDADTETLDVIEFGKTDD